MNQNGDKVHIVQFNAKLVIAQMAPHTFDNGMVHAAWTTLEFLLHVTHEISSQYYTCVYQGSEVLH